MNKDYLPGLGAVLFLTLVAVGFVCTAFLLALL